MIERHISTKIVFCSLEELSEKEKDLLDLAKSMTSKAYAPFSGFLVGAACLLENGEVVTGNNQENASYPAGICAERTAVFYASANYPNVPIELIAVAAQNSQGFLAKPISPCGICRQVLLEMELRHDKNIRILLFGTEEIAIIEKASDLLPLSFKF